MQTAPQMHKELAHGVLWVATRPPAPGVAGVKARQHALALQAVLCEPMPDEALEHSSYLPALACLIEKLFVKKTPVGIKTAASGRKKGGFLRRTS